MSGFGSLYGFKHRLEATVVVIRQIQTKENDDKHDRNILDYSRPDSAMNPGNHHIYSHSDGSNPNSKDR